MSYRAEFRGGPLADDEHDRHFVAPHVARKLVFAQFDGARHMTPGGWTLYETRPELITPEAWDDLGPDRRAVYVLTDEGTVDPDDLTGDDWGVAVYRYQPEGGPDG